MTRRARFEHVQAPHAEREISASARAVAEGAQRGATSTREARARGAEAVAASSEALEAENEARGQQTPRDRAGGAVETDARVTAPIARPRGRPSGGRRSPTARVSARARRTLDYDRGTAWPSPEAAAARAWRARRRAECRFRRRPLSWRRGDWPMPASADETGAEKAEASSARSKAARVRGGDGGERALDCRGARARTERGDAEGARRRQIAQARCVVIGRRVCTSASGP